jgi:hypothetical protein
MKDTLALMRGLVAKPDSLTALRLRETNEIIVIERGVRGNDGDLVAARLMLDGERRTALVRLTRKHGQARWRPARAASHWGTGASPSAVQILGRVLSIIHPVSQNAEPQVA